MNSELPAESGIPDDTGYEECIVPSDMNLLSDDDFREIVNEIPPGVSFTFIADSCHSGGLIDHEKQQIGNTPHAAGPSLLSGGRPEGRPTRPEGGPTRPTRPEAGMGGGDGGLVGMVAQGLEAYPGGQQGGRNGGLMGVVAEGLESEFGQRSLPVDQGNKGFVPPELEQASGRGGFTERGFAGNEKGAHAYPETSDYPSEGAYHRPEGTRRDYMQTSYGRHGSPEGAYGKPELGRHPEIFDYPSEGAYYRPEGIRRDYMESSYGVHGPPQGAYGEPELGRHPEAVYGMPDGGRQRHPEDARYGYPGETYGGPEDGRYGHPEGAYGRPQEQRPISGPYERPEEGIYSYPGGSHGRLEEGAMYNRYEERPHEEHKHHRSPERTYGNHYGDEEGRRYTREEYERPEFDKRREQERREGYYGGDAAYDSRPPYPPRPRPGGVPESDSSYSQTGHIGRHHAPVVNKSLDIGTLTQILSQRTQHDVKVGNIRTTLYNMFGEDASPMVKVFVNVVVAQLQGRAGGGDSGATGGGGGGHGGLVGKIGSLAAQFLKIKLHDQGSDHVQPAVGAGGYGRGHAAPIQAAFAGYKPPRYGRRGDVGILISACESDEASADASPTSNPKHAYGALSNAIQTIVGESQGPLTNRQLVFDARRLLAQQGYKQHPCLFSSDQNADAPFICQ
ncbi:hypothetical protein CY35_05G081300 [Sphagnum magellanicum]|nr:hypothetical protein CY35_05G081300 [Sphagnum magellanicum]